MRKQLISFSLKTKVCSGEDNAKIHVSSNTNIREHENEKAWVRDRVNIWLGLGLSKYPALRVREINGKNIRIRVRNMFACARRHV